MLESHCDTEIKITAARETERRSVVPVTSFKDLPFELLEHVAYYLNYGHDLVNWLEACKGAVVQLGDSELITNLPSILGHSCIALKDRLHVGNIANHD